MLLITPATVTYPLVAISAILLVKLFGALVKQMRLKKQMPPGPTGLPWIGNVHQLGQFPWYRFHKWKQQYGSIFSLNLAGQPVIVLNDFSVIADLIDRRSAMYCDRPRMVMVGEIMSKDLTLPLARYDSRWRSMRKAATACLSPNIIESYRAVQGMHSYMLLLRILQHAEEWQEQIRFTMSSTIFCTMYGRSPKELYEKPHTLDALNAFIREATVAARLGTYLVDLIPQMLYLPKWLAPWKRYGEAFFETNNRLFLSLLNESRTQKASTAAQQTLSIDLMKMEDEKTLDIIESAWLCGSIYVAGMETSATVVETLVLAMLLYPEILRAAQNQIDKVVGRDRLPTFQDLDELPYVHAVAKEILRWRPPAPLSLPKRCTQDNWYNGHFIPEGTMVLENVWAANHDPKYFEDPDAFHPERYLDAEGRLTDPIPDSHGFSHDSFGSGRRICVGKEFAMQGLLMNVAVLLWGAKITPAVDNNGNAILPSSYDLLDSGVVVRPLPFRCSIEPRSPNVLACLDGALDEQYKMDG